MTDIANESSGGVRSNWWLPFCLTIAGWGVFLPLELYLDPIIGSILYLLTIVPFTGFFLLLAKRQTRQRVSILLLFSIYLIISWGLSKNPIHIRSDLRWLLQAEAYKSEVLKRPNASSGEFKHTEWEGWGFPGSGDTVMYLVFDPEDSLQTASKSKASGTFHGIPCPVVGVERLASHWYTVLFYTDTEWGRCS
jgi:hypothetical protein